MVVCERSFYRSAFFVLLLKEVHYQYNINSNIELVKAVRIDTNDKQPARYFTSNNTQMIVGEHCFHRSAASTCKI